MNNQNNGGGEANRKKLELPLNEPVVAKVLKAKPYDGESRYGKFHLWSLDVSGEEIVFFPDEATNQKLVALDLGVGDVIELTRFASQNGKKITSHVKVEVVSRGSSEPGVSHETREDGYRQLKIPTL